MRDGASDTTALWCLLMNVVLPEINQTSGANLAEWSTLSLCTNASETSNTFSGFKSVCTIPVSARIAQPQES